MLEFMPCSFSYRRLIAGFVPDARFAPKRISTAMREHRGADSRAALSDVVVVHDRCLRASFLGSDSVARLGAFDVKAV
jgi:hypothetical protein